MGLNGSIPFEQLEELIPLRMGEKKVPGLSIAVVRDAKVLWSSGFGVANVETGEPVTADTVFSAQSLSKPVFAYGVLKLYEEGVIDLDTPLTEYTSEPYLLEDPHVGEITMRHVLSHTCGFPNWRPEGKPLKVLFSPGERFSYSGEGYKYLGSVIEELTGEPLDRFMDEKVLTPLCMGGGFTWGEEKGDLVTAHDGDGAPRGVKRWDEANPAASLCCSALDYARFICALMRPGEDECRLSEETTSEMLTPQVGVYFSISWGLGWGIQHTGQGDAFWQWGQGGAEGGGYQNFVTGFMEGGLGVVVMTNGSNGLRICEEVVRGAIGGEHPAFSDYLKI